MIRKFPLREPELEFQSTLGRTQKSSLHCLSLNPKRLEIYGETGVRSSLRFSGSLPRETNITERGLSRLVDRDQESGPITIEDHRPDRCTRSRVLCFFQSSHRGPTRPLRPSDPSRPNFRPCLMRGPLFRSGQGRHNVII